MVSNQDDRYNFKMGIPISFPNPKMLGQNFWMLLERVTVTLPNQMIAQ